MRLNGLEDLIMYKINYTFTFGQRSFKSKKQALKFETELVRDPKIKNVYKTTLPNKCIMYRWEVFREKHNAFNEIK